MLSTIIFVLVERLSLDFIFYLVCIDYFLCWEIYLFCFLSVL